ncbi:phage tail protein [Chitinimonas arctica]|uniref:Phage tail protein n=1 Tax=Chitinimonas arctica TaxID=2594795 RepID=A0A516SHQ7_9NEIS|nr:phage tail protein [Chitinimonas arctica]QDQ27686.1 phage tail protein [Chitinimonas arctica]QDQ29153.1 phage tail protein [Chitinimonas arctica]
MMSLGMFVFELITLPFQEMQQDIGWRFPTASRIGKRPARQFLGPDDETITLSGVLFPEELTGGERELALVRAMADEGKAYPLIAGTGDIYGVFVIEALKVTRQLFYVDGSARRLEFTLSLKREDDEQVDQLGQVYAAF